MTTTTPVFLLAPAPGMTFSGTPSGTVYVSDQYGLVVVTNGSVADMQMLIAAGCQALTPNVIGTVSPQSGTIYQIQSIDQNGMLLFTASSVVSAVLPNNLPPGFGVTLYQAGIGQVSASAQPGGTVVSPGSTVTPVQYSYLFCVVLTNTTGFDAEWAVIAIPSPSYAGVVGATTLLSLYEQDSSAHYAQWTIAQVLSDSASSNNGVWLKSGTGNGSGNWTQESTLSLTNIVASLVQVQDDVTAAASRAASGADGFRLRAARPLNAKLGLRLEPGVQPTDFTQTWTYMGGAGSRYAWGADGNFAAIPTGSLRHSYDSRATGGDGKYQGVLLGPYATNANANPTFTGGATGDPGTLPTGYTLTGSGFTSQVTGLGTEYGINYIELQITSTTGTQATLLTPAANYYVNSSGTNTNVASGQSWCASGRLKVMSNSGLSSCYAVCGQNSSGTSSQNTGNKALPLTPHYRRGHATFTTSGAPESVFGGFQFNFAAGASFTVRVALPQTEPSSFAGPEIPIANGYVAAEYFSLSGATLVARLGAAPQQGTVYAEFTEPYWIDDGDVRPVFTVLDTSTGGQLKCGGFNNQVSCFGENWNGSSSTQFATLGSLNPSTSTINGYNNIPGFVTKWAATFGTNWVATCRDNHQVLSTTAGTIFTVTPIGSITIGNGRPLVLREFSMWDVAISAPELRELSRNYENFDLVKEWRVQDSKVLSPSLGTAISKSCTVANGSATVIPGSGLGAIVSGMTVYGAGYPLMGSTVTGVNSSAGTFTTSPAYAGNSTTVDLIVGGNVYQLGNMPDGTPFQSYGLYGSDQGVSAFVKGGELRAPFNGPDAATVNLAAYTGINLPTAPKSWGAVLVWHAVENETLQIASATLISMRNPTLLISSITEGAVHCAFLVNSCDLGVYDGTFSFDTVDFPQVPYDEEVFAAVHVLDGRCICELPDGRIYEPSQSANMAGLYHGSFITWEHFSDALGTGNIVNEASFRTFMVRS